MTYKQKKNDNKHTASVTHLSIVDPGGLLDRSMVLMLNVDTPSLVEHAGEERRRISTYCESVHIIIKREREERNEEKEGEERERKKRRETKRDDRERQGGERETKTTERETERWKEKTRAEQRQRLSERWEKVRKSEGERTSTRIASTDCKKNILTIQMLCKVGLQPKHLRNFAKSGGKVTVMSSNLLYDSLKKGS